MWKCRSMTFSFLFSVLLILVLFPSCEFTMNRGKGQIISGIQLLSRSWYPIRTLMTPLANCFIKRFQRLLFIFGAPSVVPISVFRPPWWYRSRPALRGGVSRAGVPRTTPALYPALFSTVCKPSKNMQTR